MRSVTDYPVDESDRQALMDYGAARRKGDMAAAQAAMRRFKASPPTLAWVKELMGADHVRAWYDTTLADKEFGPDWLDRDD